MASAPSLMTRRGVAAGPLAARAARGHHGSMPVKLASMPVKPSLLLAAALCASLVVAPAAARDRGRAEMPSGPRAGNSYANPSAVIATELAFATAARAEGQWTAFARFAAPDAVMFVPQLAWAQTWLKGRANPAVPLAWQPHAVWSSCDGSVVVSHGAWQRGGITGWFTTIWQRQPDGAYKWIVDHGDTLRQPAPAPEMLSALIADCPAPARQGPGHPPAGKPAKPKKIKLADLPPLDPAHRAGAATDGSLRWDVTVSPSGARHLTVDWTREGATARLLDETVAAPPPGQS